MFYLRINLSFQLGAVAQWSSAVDHTHTHTHTHNTNHIKQSGLVRQHISHAKERHADTAVAQWKWQDAPQAGRINADANAREAWYNEPTLSTSVFNPSLKVERPYGSWDMEARVGQGRIVTSTRAMLHFLNKYYISGPHMGKLLTSSTSTVKRG